MRTVVGSSPLRLVSVANTREHWRRKAKRAKEHRVLGYFICPQASLKSKPPYHVVIVRIGKRLLDDDNLASACKALRDGIADRLGVDDGDVAKVTWAYRQEIGKGYGVRVEVRGR